MKSQSRHRTEASNPTSSVELLLNFKNLTKLIQISKTLSIMLPNPVIMRVRSHPSPYTSRIQ